MDYSKFFTPKHIAELLINQMEVSKPDAVIDICCGSCNLLYAAKNRWPTVQMKGIDIADHQVEGVDFEQLDGREYAISHPGEYEFIVANPPFGYVKTKREYPEVFEGGFEDYNTSRLENEMLIANLKLLRLKGKLLIIMPSTFVEAESSKKLRSLVINNYHVDSIIKLPDNTFGSGQINSYALIIGNLKVGKKISMYYTVEVEPMSYQIVKEDDISSFDFIEGRRQENCSCSIKQVLDMKRGNISSALFVEHGIPVLHIGKNAVDWKPSIRFIKEEVKNSVWVEEGDIIVSRIGKSAGKWCQYTGERMMISDCLFRIKDPTGSVINRIDGRQYDHTIKGVATRYITTSDFLFWYNSL